MLYLSAPDDHFSSNCMQVRPFSFWWQFRASNLRINHKEFHQLNDRGQQPRPEWVKYKNTKYIKIKSDRHVRAQTSNIKHAKTKILNVCRVAVVFAQSIEACCQVENKDVVGAVPTIDAPTTSEWSTSLSPTKVQLILKAWW